MEYKVIKADLYRSNTGSGRNSLTDYVNEAINDSWEPQGGVFIHKTQHYTYAYQAMIRLSEEDKLPPLTAEQLYELEQRKIDSAVIATPPPGPPAFDEDDIAEHQEDTLLNNIAEEMLETIEEEKPRCKECNEILNESGYCPHLDCY